MKNSFAILLLFVLVAVSKQLYVNVPNDLEADQVIHKNLVSRRISRNINSTPYSSSSESDEETNHIDVGSGEAPTLKEVSVDVRQVRGVYITQQDNIEHSSGEEPINERVKRDIPEGSGEQISFNVDPVGVDNGSGQEAASI